MESVTVTLLREAGEALYGARWQSDMAAALDVNRRTIRRWATGDHPIPAGAWAAIDALVRDRRRALTSIALRITLPTIAWGTGENRFL